MHARRNGALALIALIGFALAPSLIAQDSTRAASWELGLSARAGVPTGWVQVRENTVVGTRLPFGSALDVHAIYAGVVSATLHPDGPTRIEMAITSFWLSGTSTPADSVHFNGTTLEAGAPLHTRTGFPHYLAITVTGTHDVAQFGGGAFGVTGGLSFVALTFVLEGTLTPTSATRETQEDFITQELPVPVLGAEYRLPLGARWRLDARLTGGWLPWVNSLRKEGGTVSITQTELQGVATFRYAASRAIDLTLEARASQFAQNEQSNEDGNQIAIRAVSLGAGAAWRF